MKHIKLFENFLIEGRGPQGYFPPMGATPSNPRNSTAENIFNEKVAIKVATDLKKLLDKANIEYAKQLRMVAPFVNYYPSTREGNLILGVVFTDLPTYNFSTRDWKAEHALDEIYKPQFKKILESAKTKIWSDFHNGINGRYGKYLYKSGIVYSLCTPGREFDTKFANTLKGILGLNYIA